MPTERVVEVVTGSYREGLNPKAAPSAPMHEKFTASAKVAPSSLAAAMLTLAEAYTARRQADEQGVLAARYSTTTEDEIAAIVQRYEAADEALEAAWAALEQHPHYRRPE